MNWSKTVQLKYKYKKLNRLEIKPKGRLLKMVVRNESDLQGQCNNCFKEVNNILRQGEQNVWEVGPQK